MIRKAILSLLALGALAAPGAAAAGGWATAGLNPPTPPAGSGAGDAWEAEITVLQHGQTPLAGVEPALVLTSTGTAERLEFPAEPTGQPGVYRVVATLPEEGTWRVGVYDGFTEYGGDRTHTFAPITIGAPDAPAAGLRNPLGGVLAAALAAGLALAALVVHARRSRRKAAAAA